MLFSVLVLSLSTAGSPDSIDLSSYTVPSLTPQEAAAKTDPQWAGNVLIGFTDTSGNTDLTNIALDANAEKEFGDSRYTSKLYWSYTATDGDITERKAGLSFQYDYLAGEDYFYYTNIGAEVDKEAQIDLRWRGGVGVGYDLIKKEKVTFTGEVGLSYIITQFSELRNPTPPPANYTPGDDSTMALRLAYAYANKLSDETKLTQTFEAFPSISDSDDVFLRLDTRLTTNLTERMLGSLAYIFDWDNTPAAGARRGDHRVVLSIGWGFGA